MYQTKEEENSQLVRKLNENVDLKNIQNIRLKNMTKKQIGS